MGGRRRFALLAAALMALLLLAAPAGAVTVSVSGNTLYITGGSENNNVDLDGTGDTWWYVTDTAGVSAGPGCSADTVTPGVYDCGDASTVNVDASLGGGDDQLKDNFLFDCGTCFLWHHPVHDILVDAGQGNNTVDLANSHSGDGIAEHAVQVGDGSNSITVADATDHNVVDGGNGNDTVYLETGNNTVGLGDGNDTINGLNGYDTVTVGSGTDHINEGQFCGPNDCTVGSLTLNAVNGGPDLVTCGLGPNVLYVDQFDTLGSDCHGAHLVKVGSGRPTPRPANVSFPAHCARHHGKRNCTQPRPLRGHTYSGRTSQGRTIKLTVDKHGHYVAGKSTGIQMLCPGGDGRHALHVTNDDLSFGFGDHVGLSKRGSFSTTFAVGAGGGWSHEVIYLTAAFDGHKAKGSLVTNAKVAGAGECSSGLVSWTAR